MSFTNDVCVKVNKSSAAPDAKQARPPSIAFVFQNLSFCINAFIHLIPATECNRAGIIRFSTYRQTGSWILKKKIYIIIIK